MIDARAYELTWRLLDQLAGAGYAIDEPLIRWAHVIGREAAAILAGREADE